jgi:hypothetical protein
MSNFSGEEMAKMMKPGVRVVRGKDWDMGNQVGNGPGTVLQRISGTAFWWEVLWDNNPKSLYNIGKNYRIAEWVTRENMT